MLPARRGYLGHRVVRGRWEECSHKGAHHCYSLTSVPAPCRLKIAKRRTAGHPSNGSVRCDLPAVSIPNGTSPQGRRLRRIVAGVAAHSEHKQFPLRPCFAVVASSIIAIAAWIYDAQQNPFGSAYFFRRLAGLTWWWFLSDLAGMKRHELSSSGKQDSDGASKPF